MSDLQKAIQRVKPEEGIENLVEEGPDEAAETAGRSEVDEK
jgi:hypothetical protein